MTLDFQLTPKEFREISSGHQYGAHQALGSLVYWRFSYLIFIPIASLIAFQIFGQALVSVISILIYAAFWKIFDRIYARKFYRIYYAEDRNQIALQHWTMELSEDGISMISTLGKSFYSWKTIKFRNETKEFVLLWYSLSNHISVPKRIFRDPTDLDRFKTIIGERMEKPINSSNSAKPQ